MKCQGFGQAAPSPAKGIDKNVTSSGSPSLLQQHGPVVPLVGNPECLLVGALLNAAAQQGTQADAGERGTSLHCSWRRGLVETLGAKFGSPRCS